MALVDRRQLASFMQRLDLDGDTAETAVSLAVADLRPRVRSRPWPSTKDECEDLWAAVLRLAAYYVDNPLGRRVSTSGGVTDEWEASVRGDIIAEVASRYGAVAPVGSFPPPSSWPGRT